jgi:hypothetical protein
MLPSRLTPGTAKPLMRPEGVLPLQPRSATDGGSPFRSLVPYLECATGQVYVSIGWICSLGNYLTVGGWSLFLDVVLPLGT